MRSTGSVGRVSHVETFSPTVVGLASDRPIMAAAEAADQGRRPLQFCREMVRAWRASLFVSAQQNRLLRRRFAVPPQAAAALTAISPPAGQRLSSMGGCSRTGGFKRSEEHTYELQSL